MKTLYVIRHAKSSWDNPLLADFDRPLNARGERDAPRMGKRLKEKDITPDLIISSPAKRALTTCIIISKILSCPESLIKTEQRLYHADEETILNILQGLPDYADTVMLYGHNPGLTDFVNELFNTSIANVPTCGVVCGKIDVDKWKDVTWGGGDLVFFDYPKATKD